MRAFFTLQTTSSWNQYLTPGYQYDIKRYDGSAFTILQPGGRPFNSFCLQRKDAHLQGGSWILLDDDGALIHP